ncbi:MAG TPA: hypothetical protein PLP20_07090, partial [Oscillospiraceae bacterium]|nr:hypothetical protein [Oscillospiraceae bacterium]
KLHCMPSFLMKNDRPAVFRGKINPAAARPSRVPRDIEKMGFYQRSAPAEPKATGLAVATFMQPNAGSRLNRFRT